MTEIAEMIEETEMAAMAAALVPATQLSRVETIPLIVLDMI
jgi:hypothetical protein